MSPTLRVYDLAPSPNNFKVRIAAAVKGIDYERIPVSGQDRSNILAATGQPMTPAITYGDIKLWDSHAIVRFLDSNFDGPALFPADREGIQAIERWEQVARTQLVQPISLCFGELFSAAPDAEVLSRANDLAQEVTATLEEALTQSAYLTGDQLNAADIFCASMVHYTCIPEEQIKPDTIPGFFGAAMQLGPDRARTRAWCQKVMAHCPE
jgi:glutathione S-transferase